MCVCVSSLESLWKQHSVIINGKAVCDGGGRLNEQQIALLDQWCNTETEASETRTHTWKENSEAEGPVESRSLPENRELVVEQKSEMEWDREKIFSADLMNPDDSFNPTADGAEDNEFGCSKEPVQLTSGQYTGKNMNGNDLGTKEIEAQVSDDSLRYDLRALLADNHAQSFTDHTWFQPIPTGWHFPVRYQMSGVNHHPLQYPSTTYNHGFQENTHFKGTALYFLPTICPSEVT